MLFLELRKAGSRWVGVAALVVALLPSHHLYSGTKLSSVASPSSVGLEEGVSVASSGDTRSAHAATISDAYVAVALVIGRGSVALALRSLALVLQLLALRPLVLLVREAAPRISRLVDLR
jgi:hypothetical protein